MNHIVQDPLQCPAPNAEHAGHPNNRHFRMPGMKFGETLVRRTDIIFLPLEVL